MNLSWNDDYDFLKGIYEQDEEANTSTLLKESVWKDDKMKVLIFFIFFFPLYRKTTLL